MNFTHILAKSDPTFEDCVEAITINARRASNWIANLNMSATDRAELDKLLTFHLCKQDQTTSDWSSYLHAEMERAIAAEQLLTSSLK